MALQFDLQKSTQALSFALEKHEVAKILPCQVHMVMDVSGSFEDEHRDGYTQQLMNRFVPFSMLFDKDKVLDSYAFGSRAKQLPQITAANYAAYIKKHMPYSNGKLGYSTNYADAFTLMIESCQEGHAVTQAVQQGSKKTAGFLGRLFGRSEPIAEPAPAPVAPVAPSKEKHLFFFVTDGQPDSASEAKTKLDELMQDNVFIVFISVNPRPVSFLETFATAPHTMYLNYTPNQLRSLERVSDEDLYAQLLAAPQLVTWMNK